MRLKINPATSKQAKDDAWEASLKPIRNEAQQLVNSLNACGNQDLINEKNRLQKDKSINRKKIASLARKSFGSCDKTSSQTES